MYLFLDNIFIHFKEKTIFSNIKRKRKNKIDYFDLHPENPLSERNNYKLIDNTLGEGTPREEYRRNIELWARFGGHHGRESK